MTGNRDLQLPSGARATVQLLNERTGTAGREYYVWSGNGTLARLTAADVEALYADSIAGDGGRDLQGTEYGDDVCKCGHYRNWHGGMGLGVATFCKECRCRKFALP